MLGSRPLHRLTTEDIDTLYTRLRRQGLAPSTIRRTHILLHSALNQAVKWGQITSNPAHLATLPRVGQPAPRPVPDAARVRAAIAAADPLLAVLLRLAVHTGARRGELVRLRWSDVDVDGGAVSIYQPKTRSPKVLALGPATVDALIEWRHAVAVQYEAVDGRMPDDWWVFPSPRRWGHHISPNAVTHAWGRLRRQVGLDDQRLHDLRGTMSTTLLTGGHDVRTVQGRGGWTSPSMLLSRYAQFVTEADRRAAAAMDDWLDETNSSS
ncbi:MAG: tyrosine-type recombinase/integrase [Acidimicrobiales bacterium]